MLYQQYRNAIFAIWKQVSAENFKIGIEPASHKNEEYVLCGLCNPEFGAMSGRDENSMCPLDTRSIKDFSSEKPCCDSCMVLSSGTTDHKLRISMAKFMNDFVTKEGIESIKTLQKALKKQKGVSASAAKEFVAVTEKVIKSTERFGGFEFDIVDGKLTGRRRND